MKDPVVREEGHPQGAAGEEVIPTFCSMCGPAAGCGIYGFVRHGRLVRIEGMKECPVNRGRLCAKAFASVQWLYSPQRLKYPLRRVGEKGQRKFARISWDEAVAVIAERLKELKEKYGPECLAVLSPAARPYKSYFQRFLTAYGSPNYAHSGICAVQRAFGMAYTLGSPHLIDDYENARLIILWGINPVYAGAPRGGLRRLLDARERGARLIVIKPELQPDAAKADIWVPIRPGTDGALALAMLHVIINERLYDAGFIEKWCYGFDRLVPHVQKYTPEWAEEITGLSAGLIREIARLYATTRPACLSIGNAFDQTVASNNAVRAVAILMAITGNLDRPGGNLFPAKSPMPRLKPIDFRERLTPELAARLVAPEIAPCFQPFIEGLSSAYYRTLESVLTGRPYPVRAVIAAGTQPLVSNRGPRRVIEALKRLEFFVVIDVMENSSLPWADVVVPVATMYECDHPFEVAGNWIMARRRVIEPLGDYKSDYQFWLELGTKMGYGADFWHGDIEACLNYQLENFGLTMDELRRYPTGITYPSGKMEYEKYAVVFGTPSPRFGHPPYLPQGKVAIYNTTFEENGFNPLPEWVGPPESPTTTPGLLHRYPLIFYDAHTSDVYTAAWLRNVPYLREIQPEPWLHIHPETARQRGIGDGDRVIVASPHGRMRVKAVYFPGIRPDTVMGLHGWWQGCEELGLPGYPLLDDGANVNLMYSVDPAKAFDPVVTAMPKQTLVEVTKDET